ncbi:MAG: DUF721 domain-containing protein [Actinomycetota bacterium]|nr:DUF721 domain-containing protein [Actinomycetota bacterium]
MEPLSAALKKSTERMGLGSIYEAGQLIHVWAEIVGDQIAKKTQPVMIRGEVLVVKTANPAWSHQLTMLKPQLLTKLHEAGVGVNNIVYRAAAAPQKTKTPEKQAEIKAPPNYEGLPEEMEPGLRRAIASFVGARDTKQQPKDNK